MPRSSLGRLRASVFTPTMMPTNSIPMSGSIVARLSTMWATRRVPGSASTADTMGLQWSQYSRPSGPSLRHRLQA